MVQNYDFMPSPPPPALLELFHLGVLAVPVLIVKDSEENRQCLVNTMYGMKNVCCVHGMSM
jgi:hypothetical protein